MTNPWRTRFLDHDTRPRPKTAFWCARCQKAIKPGSPYRLVHIIAGGPLVLHPEDEALYRPDDGDMGLHPVGMDCARRLGLEWTHKPR